MTPFALILDFFQNLATDVPELEGRMMHGDVRRFQDLSRSTLTYPLLWLETPNQDLSDVADNPKLVSACAFAILDSSPADTPANEDEVWKRTQEISLAVVNSLLSRLNEPSSSKLIEVTSVRFDPIDPLFVDHLRGWRIEVTLTHLYNLC